MKRFVRMISRSNWPNTVDKLNEYFENVNEIPAKAITQDINAKGSNNALSIWELKDERDLILSMINGNKTTISKMFFLFLDEELLQSYGFEAQNKQGTSLVQELNQYHYDIENMTYESLGEFAKVIITALKDENNNLKRIDEIIVKKTIIEAVNEGKIEKDELNVELRKKLFGDEVA